MILIYSRQITPRLQYIVKFIFAGILQVPFEITTDTEQYQSHKGPKINYSLSVMGGVIILPASLLFKTGIEDIEIGVHWENSLPILFHECADEDLPFDPFAASFYMVSRYEEAVSKERDIHGRFLSGFSLAEKNGFLHIPVVDRWALLIRKAIEEKYPRFRFPERTYSFIPTIDVDSVAIFKGKPIIRIIGATIKAFLRGDYAEISARWKTLVLNHPDPYDTFGLINQWHSKCNIKPIFFFLVGKRSTNDGNISPDNKVMKQIISDISGYADIGIHPSYRSNSQKEIIEEEIQTLQKITQKTVIKSRQHFLKMNLPETYQVLLSCGIQEEYSMGFADSPGFRAGTCTPFMFYNLQEEKETTLQVFPLAYMDASSIHYEMQQPAEAIEEINIIIREVKKVNGTFISLWHNQTFSELGIYKGWRDVYRQLLMHAVK